MIKKHKVCCVIGHRNIGYTDCLSNRINKVFKELICDGTDTFLFGSKSDFNSLCLDCLSELKEDYTHIKLIYVRAEFPYIDQWYETRLLRLYDDTYMPERVVRAGKAAYLERNFHMIDRSDICVFYYDENYIPEKRATNNGASIRTPRSGTRSAYRYAITKNKRVVNLFTSEAT